MKAGKNIEKVIRELDLSLDINPKADKAILSEILKAHEKTKSQRSDAIRPNIGRTIMNIAQIKKVKAAIAVILLIVLLNLIPYNGTTAFGKIASEITSTLAILKAMVLGNEIIEDKLPKSEYVERKIDKSVKVFTRSIIYSSPDISSLEDLLNEQNISFVLIDSGVAKYAVIPSDKVAMLKEFLHSSNSYDIVTSPDVLAYAGQTATIVISNFVGAAITAVQDENKLLIIDFAFHNGLDGCDLKGISLENGEALLITGIKNDRGETSNKLVTILVLPEVRRE